MAATLIEPTEPIEVSFVPILFFGPPGCGKSTLAQTADNPLTLDFDKGIHRCANRRRAMRFDTWQDCIEAGEQGLFAAYRTLVIDTGGRALDTMIPGILKESSKNGYAGNLSPQGWGILGSRFTTWLKTVASWGKEVVFVCHQEEAKNAAGDPYFLPDLPGKMSYKEIHKSFDLIGRIRHEGRKRLLDFNPTENSIGKNAAGWQPIELPDLHQHPTFLADLIADAKQKIGKTAEASAALAKAVEHWQAQLRMDPNIEQFNYLAAQALELPAGPIKTQVTHLIKKHANQCGLKYDKAAKAFVKEVAA